MLWAVLKGHSLAPPDGSGRLRFRHPLVPPQTVSSVWQIRLPTLSLLFSASTASSHCRSKDDRQVYRYHLVSQMGYQHLLHARQGQRALSTHCSISFAQNSLARGLGRECNIPCAWWPSSTGGLGRGLGNLAIAANNMQHYVIIDNYIPLCHNILSIVTRPFLLMRALWKGLGTSLTV